MASNESDHFDELNELEEDEAWYSDDPLEEKKVSLQSKMRAFVPIVVVVIAAVYFLPSTVGGKINLSSGTNTEYGQAVNVAVACAGSTNVTVTPKSILKNEANGTGTHYLESIQVSNIPNGCNGVDFVLNVFDESSSTPLALFNDTSTNAVVWNKAGTFRVGSGGTGMSVSSGIGKFTVTFTNPAALSSSAFKVTIQSVVHKDFACALGGTCVLGDTGPAGGKIFYASEAGFACGELGTATCNYLEATPSNWGGSSDPTRTWIPASESMTSFSGQNLSLAIGAGAANTKKILDMGFTDSATSAAALAASYIRVVNGLTFDDWYLPSGLEMNELNARRASVGYNAMNIYWTSNTVAVPNATYAYFISSTPDNFGRGTYRGSQGAVRPIRAF